MKHGLLLLAIAAAMLVSAPAFAQYVYLDVDMNGTAYCTNPGDDALGPGTYDIDVYFDTNHNMDGSVATCDTGDGELTINSYEITLGASGSGSVTFNKWMNNIAGAGTNLSGGTVGVGSGGDPGLLVGGSDAYIGLGGSTLYPAGLYKVGTLNVTVTGNPVLSWLSFSSVSGVAETAFGSQCSGMDGTNTIKLGPSPPQGTPDFTDNCGTAAPTPVVNKTWGQIKDLYR
jgi:hypothetical protein